MPDDEKLQGAAASLPIEAMVAAPVTAAIRAQVSLSRELADFINKVGFDKEGNVRMVPFNFSAPIIGEDGKPNGRSAECTVKAPFIALTGIPNFAIEELEVDFSIMIEGVEHTQYKNDSSSKGGDRLPGSSGLNIMGSVSAGSNQTRKTDTNARYQFKLSAKKQAPSEALMRILDILTETTIKPIIKDKIEE